MAAALLEALDMRANLPMNDRLRGILDLVEPHAIERLHVLEALLPRLVGDGQLGVVDEVGLGGVRSVTMAGPRVTAQLRDGGAVETYVPEADRRQLVKQLEAQDVAITARPDRSGASLAAALVWLLPIALLIAAWIFVMRQMQGAGSGAMEFKKSRARQLNRDTGRTRFNDVAGIDEARGDLEEIVDFLRDPGKFLRLGGRIPSGVLLVGQPGTGKTMLAIGLARAALHAGHRVYFTTAAELAKRCRRAALEGRWATAMRFYAGPRLLVIDEFAYARHHPDPEANTALFEVISRRYLRSSTILTSHAGVASWGERLADPMLAAALLDRLLHRGVVVAIDGPSYRMRAHQQRTEALRRALTSAGAP